MELDLEHVRGRPLTLAGFGWLFSFALGLAAAALLYGLNLIRSPIMVAVALTTTAIGTLLPILRDGGELETEFGRLILAAAAMGEFGPIVVASVAFTAGVGAWTQVGFMVALIAITFLVALIALRARSPRIVELLARTMHSSTQLPVRLSMLLVALLFVLSEIFGLEAVLGAFAAGMVFGMTTKGESGKPMRRKMGAVCFGFFVPFFFVTSGINFDLLMLLQSTKTMLLIPLFLALFLAVRGTPVFFTGVIWRGESVCLSPCTRRRHCPWWSPLPMLGLKPGACKGTSRLPLWAQRFCPFYCSLQSPGDCVQETLCGQPEEILYSRNGPQCGGEARRVGRFVAGSSEGSLRGEQ